MILQGSIWSWVLVDLLIRVEGLGVGFGFRGFGHAAWGVGVRLGAALAP